MNWAKNLNARPRLMGSFGVVLLLTLGISYLAIVSLSNANVRLNALFEDDWAGSRQANQIANERLSLGRGVRDAMLNISNPDVVENNRSEMLASFKTIHTTLDGMGKTFYSKEGKAALAKVARSNGTAKPNASARAAKVAAKQTAVVAAPSGAGNDASFEEF